MRGSSLIIVSESIGVPIKRIICLNFFIRIECLCTILEEHEDGKIDRVTPKVHYQHALHNLNHVTQSHHPD